MRMLTPACLAIGLVCALAGRGAGQGVALGADRIAEIDALLAGAVGKRKCVGLSAGIRYRAARWTRGYGVTRRGGGTAPDAATLFEIGSITKVFTGLLLADAVRRGEVRLDTPVAALLPDDVTLQVEGRPIELRDLATHRSGLPRMPVNFRPRRSRDPFADFGVEQLYECLIDFAPRRAPGERYDYSNLGAGLLGHVLAQRAAKPYGELLRARVLGPLGMQHTHAQMAGVELPEPERCAQLYDAIGREVDNWTFEVLAGAGALRSSVDDMLRFVDCHLGRVDLGADADHLRAAMALAARTHATAGGQETGLGWQVRDRDGVRWFWHNGLTGGGTAFAAVCPELDAGLVVLANSARATDVTPLGQKLGRLLEGYAKADAKAPAEADK